jgi:hypothetical protein
MNSTLCDNCDNFMFTYIDEDKKLYNSCKRCGNIKLSDIKCIYKSNEKIDKSKILNEYTHILEDPTLPVIYNKNIKCPNLECETNKKNSIPEVKYIKYDTENIYFMYMCNTCNQKWTNDENNI